MWDDVISDVQPSFRPLGRLPLFKPGKTAYLQGREVRVTYVHLRKGELLVHLEGHTDAVPGDHLEMEPTELVWPADRLDAYLDKSKIATSTVNPPAAEQPSPSADDIFAQAMALTPPAALEPGESADDIFAKASA